MQLRNQPSVARRAHARRFTPASSRSAALVVRAVYQPERTRSPWQTAQGVALSCAAAALLVLGAPQGSLLPSALAAEPVQTFAPADVESAYEQEVTVEEQKNMLGFMLQQQENAKKAAILAQRQQLQQEVGRVEAALQARLTQQKANVVGAKQAGDSKAIESATAAASELEEKQAQIIKAAAQLSAQLDRMELIERARSAAARQTIERAASQIDGAVNTRINPWLEAMSRAATK